MSDTDRPTPRWCHASTHLDDFAIVSWAVDPERVLAQLPAGFTPDVRADRVLVSAVAFGDRRFHFRALPFVPVSCGQVNYRTYVVADDGTRGVWFFGTSLDSRLVRLPQVAWKMPWHRQRIRFETAWDGDRCDRYRMVAAGPWGALELELHDAGGPAEAPPGYGAGDDVSRSLFDPFVGWYGRRDGSAVGRYTVWHEPLPLRAATATAARCQVFTDLGLIAPGQPPDHAATTRTTHFDVHTPPTRTSPHRR